MIYKIFSVNPDSRLMTDTAPGIAIVKHDANVDGVLFRIPNEFNTIDLTDSGTEPIVRYVLPSDPTKVYVQPTEAYSAAGLTDTPYKYYAWDFDNSVLEKSGLVFFSFCVQNATTNQDWNTRVAQLQIADTLDHTDSAISPGTKITSSIDAAIESAVSAYVDSQIKAYDTEISAELDKLNHAFDNLSLQYGEDGLVYVFSNGSRNYGFRCWGNRFYGGDSSHGFGFSGDCIFAYNATSSDFYYPKARNKIGDQYPGYYKFYAFDNARLSSTGQASLYNPSGSYSLNKTT